MFLIHLISKHTYVLNQVYITEMLYKNKIPNLYKYIIVNIMCHEILFIILTN